MLPGLIEDIDISKIKPSKNLLRFPQNIQDLQASIRQRGLLQPILLRTKDKHYEIVAGNRRYHACKGLHFKKIPSHIVELSDKEAFEVSLIENVQRKTLSPLEEAHAFKTYIADFGWGGMADLAEKIGKSASYITKRVKLLKLPQDILDSIKDCTINISIAEELCNVKDEMKRSELSEIISKRHLSLRKTRSLMKDIDEGYAIFNSSSVYEKYNLNQHSQRSMEKAVIAMRIALNRIGDIIDDERNNWIVYEILLYHRNVIHQQIDSLLKVKKKYKLGLEVRHLAKSFGAERFSTTHMEQEPTPVLINGNQSKSS